MSYVKNSQKIKKTKIPKVTDEGPSGAGDK